VKAFRAPRRRPEAAPAERDRVLGAEVCFGAGAADAVGKRAARRLGQTAAVS
jgi:hypothetical protein